ncbi:MAG: hypothetical protein ACK4UN_07325 [Limisphaerales bacterium]
MQPVPKVSGHDVERVIARDFGPDQALEVRRLFDEQPRQSSRVKLAILKLSGGDLNKIREWLSVARSDFRDVLALAEYPGYRFDTGDLPDEERQKIIDSDWKQYEAWLYRS